MSAEWWPSHKHKDKHETSVAYDDGYADSVEAAMEAVAERMRHVLMGAAVAIVLALAMVGIIVLLVWRL